MVSEVLPRSQLCCGLTAEQIKRVAEAVRKVSFASGQVVFRQNDPGNSMFIVVKGRVKIDVTLGNGHQRLVDNLGVGDHFGEVAMLTGGHRAVRMTAVVDTELLELKQHAFLRLLATVPGLAANVCRTLGYRLRRETAGRPQRAKPQVICLVNTTHRTRRLLPRIAAALASEEDHVETPPGGVRFTSLFGVFWSSDRRFERRIIGYWRLSNGFANFRRLRSLGPLAVIIALFAVDCKSRCVVDIAGPIIHPARVAEHHGRIDFHELRPGLNVLPVLNADQQA